MSTNGGPFLFVILFLLLLWSQKIKNKITNKIKIKHGCLLRFFAIAPFPIPGNPDAYFVENLQRQHHNDLGDNIGRG